MAHGAKGKTAKTPNCLYFDWIRNNNALIWKLLDEIEKKQCSLDAACMIFKKLHEPTQTPFKRVS
jgi:hypothetical protein